MRISSLHLCTSNGYKACLLTTQVGSGNFGQATFVWTLAAVPAHCKGVKNPSCIPSKACKHGIIYHLMLPEYKIAFLLSTMLFPFVWLFSIVVTC